MLNEYNTNAGKIEEKMPNFKRQKRELRSRFFRICFSAPALLSFLLLLRLFVNSGFFTPFAKLLKFNLSFYFLLIFPAPIIDSFTILASQFY
jgi:hypothetical protein